MPASQGMNAAQATFAASSPAAVAAAGGAAGGNVDAPVADPNDADAPTAEDGLTTNAAATDAL
jgi:hypothetical protein